MTDYDRFEEQSRNLDCIALEFHICKQCGEMITLQEVGEEDSDGYICNFCIEEREES